MDFGGMAMRAPSLRDDLEALGFVWPTAGQCDRAKLSLWSGSRLVQTALPFKVTSTKRKQATAEPVTMPSCWKRGLLPVRSGSFRSLMISAARTTPMHRTHSGLIQVGPCSPVCCSVFRAVRPLVVSLPSQRLTLQAHPVAWKTQRGVSSRVGRTQENKRCNRSSLPFRF